jgi:hypothetical protein
MKIRGQLIDILLEICPGVYTDYVINKGKHKILYVRMLRALYGMLVFSILYLTSFLRKDIEAIGFEVNPYDICVANQTVNRKQQTVTWHVDDLKSSHVNPKSNDEFAEWSKNTYGSNDLGKQCFCAREHGQISIQQFHFYPQESMTQTREIGRNYCGL